MILTLALLLEWWIGDPANRYHPVAWFGRWAAWCEGWLYGDDRRRGAVVWLLVVALPMMGLLILHAIFGGLFGLLMLWISIGWRSLLTHVRAVLEAESLPAARRAVGRIVSRDTAQMDMGDARRAALESLAENTSDAVIAPLFWFLCLGPIGAALYRMVNTLDAMWGYRNARYAQFGWWAAKVDDLANFFPARITARLLLWLGHNTPWQTVRAQAATHSSPNAGWPEVALAFAADLQLGGPVLRDGAYEDRPHYGRKQPNTEISQGAALRALSLVHHTLLLAAAITWVLTLVL